MQNQTLAHKLKVVQSHLDFSYQNRVNSLRLSDDAAPPIMLNGVKAYPTYNHSKFYTGLVDNLLPHIKEREDYEELVYEGYIEMLAEEVWNTLLPFTTGCYNSQKGNSKQVTRTNLLINKNLKNLSKLFDLWIKSDKAETELYNLINSIPESELEGVGANSLLTKKDKLKVAEKACKLKLVEGHFNALCSCMFDLPISKAKLKSVYLITDGESHKIGVSANVELRVKQLQIGNPKKLTLVHFIKTSHYIAYSLEARLKQEFKSDNLRGEWYDCKLNTLLLSMSGKDYS